MMDQEIAGLETQKRVQERQDQIEVERALWEEEQMKKRAEREAQIELYREQRKQEEEEARKRIE